MVPELKINVGDLDAAGKEYSFPLRAAWIRGVLEDHEATAAGADGLLDVRASRSGNDIVVHGTLKAELEVPCARCLTPVPIAVDETLGLLFVPGKIVPPPIAPKLAKEEAAAKATEKRKGSKHKAKAEPEEYELSAQDADTFPYDGELVVLDDVVRDELILATPIFPLCSEDCPGMSAPPESHAHSDGGAGKSDAGADEAIENIDPRLRPLLRLKTKPD